MGKICSSSSWTLWSKSPATTLTLARSSLHKKGVKTFTSAPHPHPQKKYALTKMTKLPTKLGINSCGANVFTLRVMQSSVLPSLSSGQSRWPHRRSENPCSAGKPEQGWQKRYCKKKMKIRALWQEHQCLEENVQRWFCSIFKADCT